MLGQIGTFERPQYFQNLPKYQPPNDHPKVCKAVRNFGATFPIFCATSATNLA